MPLTPEEQQELQALSAKYGQPKPQAPTQGGLTPDEQTELAQLHQKYGQPAQPPSLTAVAKGGDPGAPDYDPSDPQRQKMAAMTAGFATGPLAGAATEGLTGLAGVAGRIGANMAGGAAQGALEPADSAPERLGNMVRGAGISGAVSGATEAASGLSGFLKKGTDYVSRRMARMTPNQATAYVDNPDAVNGMAKMIDSSDPALKDQAAGAVAKSREVLKQQGLEADEKLKGLLTGKQVPVNPNEFRGLDPRVDELLDKASSQAGQTSSAVQHFQNEANGLPDTIMMDANDANQMKRHLQDAADFQPGTVTDPVQQARQAQAGLAAGKARQAIETAVPEVAPLNKSMQESVTLQKALRTGGKNNPLAFVSTESPDRMATLARAEQRGAGGLMDFGDQYGAAKTISQKDQDDALSRMVEKLIGRAGLRAGNAAQGAIDTATTPEVQQLLSAPLIAGTNRK